MIYEGSSEPTDLVFILRRDGINWIEFKKGLEQWELEIFFSILHDHCVLEEDAEDDIVTALWEYNLPSIKYEAADLELGLDDDIDISALPCCPHTAEGAGNKPDIAAQTSGFGPAQKVSDSNFDTLQDNDGLFVLSREERKQLDQMIAIEEKLDGSDHVVDVLLYIIETHCLPEDVNELLNYMVQAMQEALLKCRFSNLFNVLNKVNRYLDKLKAVNHWAVPHLERFFLSISSKTFLANLLKISSAIEHVPADKMDDLKKFLFLLNAETITTLAPIMHKNQSVKLNQVLSATIVHMARNNFKPLEQLLFSADQSLSGRMVYLLRYFDDPHSKQILTQLLGDESEIIRKKALKTYLRRNDLSMKELFSLLDDSDRSIRKLLLQYLGRARDEEVEELLLDYMETSRIADSEHFMDVCKTLGKCASDRSIPYIKKFLFKWPRFGILRHGRSILHRGALSTLKELNTEEAQYLMSRAGQGFFKNFLRSV